MVADQNQTFRFEANGSANIGGRFGAPDASGGAGAGDLDVHADLNVVGGYYQFPLARFTVQRTEQVRRTMESMGGRLETILWTQGRYDLVAVSELPDEETAAAATMRIASQGAVRTEVLRAFDAEEMGRILAKVG